MFWGLMIATTLLTLAILVVRLRYTGQGGHTSLTWDLFLGWIPLVPAVVAYRLAIHRRWTVVYCFALLGWLFLFPNAPYLVTELIHLHPEFGTGTSPMPEWLASILSTGQVRNCPAWLEFLLLTSTAAAGVLLSLGSLWIIQQSLRKRLRAWLVQLLMFVSICLSGLGVAIGRWERFNSWDVMRRPDQIIERLMRHVVNPAQDPKFLITAVVTAVLLLAVYLSVHSLVSAARAKIPA
jgi:uncharacterized membrane protein